MFTALKHIWRDKRDVKEHQDKGDFLDFLDPDTEAP